MTSLSTISRLLVLPVVLALAMLASQCSALNPLAFAQVEGGFDETGHYHYGSGPNASPLRPSIDQPGYEQLRQQREREDSQRNQDQLRSYHEAPAVGSPQSGGNKYNFYEPTYLPGGKVLMCAKGFHGATYCY